MSSPLAAPLPDQPQVIQPNAQRCYEVTRADLPLSCPMPDMMLWNSHPRVYLAIEDDGGESQCGYCGARYILREETR
ncbi:MAG TPA: zinc-finger domain-containing protein [Rhodanobacteraceae bacterium]|nr:zinc-finger domain-containing protein [Rhodanobacteraceae bacterium]